MCRSLRWLKRPALSLLFLLLWSSDPPAQHSVWAEPVPLGDHDNVATPRLRDGELSFPVLGRPDTYLDYLKTVGGAEQIKNDVFNTEKAIPSLLWVAVKDRNDPLPQHIQELFSRNRHWAHLVCDNDCKDKFMDTVFGNTALSWAYRLVNVWAFKADIWRYCILYTFGGVYLDDDSDMKTPLDDIVRKSDHLIMSEEGANGFGQCYESDFHLSDAAVSKRNKSEIAAVDSQYFHGFDDKGFPIFFHGHTLVNWGIFIAPRHPLMLETLKNIVAVVKAEFSHKSVVHFTRWDPPHKLGLCSTTFTLTYTLRDLLLTGYFLNASVNHLLPRVSVSDYKEYGGKCKAIWTGGDPNHYAKKMKSNPRLLSSYGHLDVETIIHRLNGKVVMGEGKSKSIYFVDNTTKRDFGNFDNFLKCGFTMSDVRHVKDHVVAKLRPGSTMTC